MKKNNKLLAFICAAATAASGLTLSIGSVDKICRQYRKSKRKEIKIMTKIMEKATQAIPDTKEGIRMLPEVEICFRMI